MTVSIIIPVYNSEKYLNRCLKSVIEQTYKKLEIIIVDDGSTDNSNKIIDTFEKKDKRIKVVHKKNGGLSSARNKGLELVTGDYVFYLDSDDYLSKDCINTLVELSKKNDADISIIKILYIAEDTNDEISISESEEVIIMDSEKAIKESLYQKKYTCCAPAKLYKKKIAMDIKFPLGRLSEDLATCHLFLDKADRIVYTSKIGYYYRQHDNSIMHKFNEKRMDALEWALEIEDFCKNKYSKIIKAAKCRTFNVAIHLLLDLPEGTKEHDKFFGRIWQNIKRTRGAVLLNNESRMRERLAAVLSYAGEKSLKLVWNSKLAIKNKEK